MSPYNHRWRTVTRPAILRRAGGRFTQHRFGHFVYRGAAKCERCAWIDCMHGGRSELDIAHLVIPPNVPGHDDATNLAALCRPCHRRHDLEPWKVAFARWLAADRDRRRAGKDAARPLFTMLLDQTIIADSR